MWGPGNGDNNGLPATSPNGGYFLALDSDFQQAPVQQTITGLTVGDNYTVSFDWAAAQQQNFFGTNSSGLQVSLGGQTDSTGLITIPTGGFSGWKTRNFNYTATAPSETLSFLAYGDPQVPPFALLDGVSLTGTPEPSPFLAMGIGVLGLGAIIRRRALANKAAA
jgi:hypothetical protein